MIERKTRALENLYKKLEKLSKKKVETGYFSETGVHIDSGLMYAELMDLHEYGDVRDNIPPRPVRAITLSILKETPGMWEGSVKAYLQDKGTLESNLNTIGAQITDTAKSLFGSSALTDNSKITIRLKGKNSPLIDAGNLMENWSWKVS